MKCLAWLIGATNKLDRMYEKGSFKREKKDEFLHTAFVLRGSFGAH